MFHMMFNLNIQREKRRTSGVYEIERHVNSVRYLGTLDRLKDLAGTHLLGEGTVCGS